METKIITKQEIDDLYKRVGVKNSSINPGIVLNTGTMSNKLMYEFKAEKTKISTIKKTCQTLYND